MSQWARPIVIVEKNTPEGFPKQFHLCIDYRKLNSFVTISHTCYRYHKGHSHTYAPAKNQGVILNNANCSFE